MKKILCIILSATMILSVGCSNNKPPKETTAGTFTTEKEVTTVETTGKETAEITTVTEPTTEATTEETVATTTTSSEVKDMTLYIGCTEESTAKVSAKCEATPESLIKALADETGWNLNIASITPSKRYSDVIVVALAADSMIYTEPPEKQKEAYHLFDVTSMIYTALTSIEQTIHENLQVDVSFASPDGGNLDVNNGGMEVFANSRNIWNYKNALSCNTKPADDEIGFITDFFPVSKDGYTDTYSPAGYTTVGFTAKRSDIEVGEDAKLTIYNEDGSVFDEVGGEGFKLESITAEKNVTSSLKEGTLVIIELNKGMEPNKKYSVGMSKGSFQFGDVKSKNFAKENWTIITADYGFEMPSNDSESSGVGDKIDIKILLGKEAVKCIVRSTEPEVIEANVTEVTENGVVTLTVKNTGACGIILEFVDDKNLTYGGVQLAYNIE